VIRSPQADRGHSSQVIESLGGENHLFNLAAQKSRHEEILIKKTRGEKGIEKLGDEVSLVRRDALAIGKRKKHGVITVIKGGVPGVNEKEVGRVLMGREGHGGKASKRVP